MVGPATAESCPASMRPCSRHTGCEFVYAACILLSSTLVYLPRAHGTINSPVLQRTAWHAHGALYQPRGNIADANQKIVSSKRCCHPHVFETTTSIPTGRKSCILAASLLKGCYTRVHNLRGGNSSGEDQHDLDALEATDTRVNQTNAGPNFFFFSHLLRGFVCHGV